MPEFTLTRGEAGTLMIALSSSVVVAMRNLVKERRRKKHRPGVAAGLAFGIDDARKLEQRLLDFCVAEGWIEKKAAADVKFPPPPAELLG